MCSLFFYHFPIGIKVSTGRTTSIIMIGFLVCREEMDGSQPEEPSEHEDDMYVREVSAIGFSMSTTEVEANLDEGNVLEAESALREGLSLNSEVRLVC